MEEPTSGIFYRSVSCITVLRALPAAALLRNSISFYHQAYRAAVWSSRQNYLGLCHSR
jgi:hypothetical protein